MMNKSQNYTGKMIHFWFFELLSQNNVSLHLHLEKLLYFHEKWIEKTENCVSGPFSEVQKHQNDLLGPSWSIGGRLEGVLRASWAVLAAFWTVSGASQKRRGPEKSHPVVSKGPGTVFPGTEDPAARRIRLQFINRYAHVYVYVYVYVYIYIYIYIYVLVHTCA